MKRYSCILPAFNENPRILAVLEAVTKVKEIAEVICVDDGSTDKTGEVIFIHFPQVKLIRHKTNKGKLSAVKTGLRSAKNNNLLLLDADLVGLKTEEISTAIKAYEDNQLDCLILTTQPMDLGYRLVRAINRATLCVAGDRVINKQLLLDILKDKNFGPYQLEVAQNYYLMKYNRKVARFGLSAVDVGKTAKGDFLNGLLKDLDMWKQIISFAGWPFFFKMSLLFARTKVG